MIHVWEQAAKMVLSMTLEEKAALVSGFDCWNTKVVESIGKLRGIAHSNAAAPDRAVCVVKVIIP